MSSKFSSSWHTYLVLIVAIASASCTSADAVIESAGTSKIEATLPNTVQAIEGLDQIKQFLIDHSPKKQVQAKSGSINSKIGRTPGSACEVIRFLTRLAHQSGADNAAAAKLGELADWVIGLQSTERGKPSYGGVPSTPDLLPPANRYYYAIDAAFCGDAMFRAYEATGLDRYFKSAVAFSEFLVTMHFGPNTTKGSRAGSGFCEYVIDTGPRLAWHCNSYVKTLIALPVLRKAATATKSRRYEDVARAARDFLIPGLKGAWEFAEIHNRAECRPHECAPTWRRVQGPQKQPDFFLYGDTPAYALRGLFEYEGVTQDVRAVYDRFSGFTGKGARSRAYDGRIAFAGYLHPASSSPDDFSAYYDLVTLGILHELRRAHRKDHFDVANAVLIKIVAAAPKLSWKMQFDLSLPRDGYIDLTTLANLGEALLVAQRANL